MQMVRTEPLLEMAVKCRNQASLDGIDMEPVSRMDSEERLVMRRDISRKAT